MSTPASNNPGLGFVDGDAAVLDSVVKNVNDNTLFLYADDSISEQGKHEMHDNPAGEAVGSITTASGRFSGSMSLQKVAATDPDPRPGHLLLFRTKYYKIAGAIGKSRTLNKVVTLKPAVEQVLNPVLLSYLSVNGQVISASGTGGAPTVAAPTMGNVRAGATQAFTLNPWTEQYADAVVPSGLSINSSTGAITGTGVAAGTYYLKVTCTDSLANERDRKGVGFLILTVTA